MAVRTCWLTRKTIINFYKNISRVEFDYNKAYEIPVHEVINRGFLVPYTYFGLTDDIDYSRIRLSGKRQGIGAL